MLFNFATRQSIFQTIAVWNSFSAQPEIAGQYAKKDK